MYARGTITDDGAIFCVCVRERESVDGTLDEGEEDEEDFGAGDVSVATTPPTDDRIILEMIRGEEGGKGGMFG